MFRSPHRSSFPKRRLIPRGSASAVAELRRGDADRYRVIHVRLCEYGEYARFRPRGGLENRITESEVYRGTIQCIIYTLHRAEHVVGTGAAHASTHTACRVTAPLAAHTLWCAAQRGSNITTVSAMPAPEPAPHGPLCTPFPQNTTRRPPVGHPSRDVAKTGVAHILPKSLPKKPSGLVPYFLRPPNLDTMISTSSGTRSS